MIKNNNNEEYIKYNKKKVISLVSSSSQKIKLEDNNRDKNDKLINFALKLNSIKNPRKNR